MIGTPLLFMEKSPSRQQRITDYETEYLIASISELFKILTSMLLDANTP